MNLINDGRRLVGKDLKPTKERMFNYLGTQIYCYTISPNLDMPRIPETEDGVFDHNNINNMVECLSKKKKKKYG